MATNKRFIKRLYYKDGNYMDVTNELQAKEYENDPEWDHTETIEDEHGHRGFKDSTQTEEKG